MGSHESRVDGQNALPHPAVHTVFDACPGTAGLVGCERTWLGNVQHIIHQHPQVLLPRAAINPFSVKLLFLLRIALKALHLALLSFRFAQCLLSNLPLDDTPSLQPVNCTVQLSVVDKLAESSLKATIHVATKMLKIPKYPKTKP